MTLKEEYNDENAVQGWSVQNSDDCDEGKEMSEMVMKAPMAATGVMDMVADRH